ncbi:MAG: hypothetical protein KatS3mg081_2131 [Gemmatimonadales bacterium]|nr:hypothetical protein HRbin33_01103 [bacterium HR33]GIW52776.1 MAG: hypothetical protein KatS3mg081_2131 [Gemmatimonadales bacterium]
MPPVFGLLAVLLAAAVGGCESDVLETPVELRGRLVSPNGPEGAAVLELIGPGLGNARAASGHLFTRQNGDTLRLVAVLEEAGTVEFVVEWFRKKSRPEVRVLEVAGGDNAIRGSLSGYRVEFTP